MAKTDNEKRRPREPQQEQQKNRSISPYRSGGMMAGRGEWPLARLRSQFDQLFDDFFHGWGGLPALPQVPESGWGFDVEDQKDKIVVRAEAPGFEPDDFDLEVRDDQLMLCACESEEKEEEGGRQWHRKELYRSIPLSSNIDAEHVDAQYRNGILTVTLPKTESGKSRRIEVKS